METIFTLGDLPEETSRVNLDDLYEKTKEANLNTLATFNSVLNRIHLKIKLMSRCNKTEQFCWYVIPEMIIGVPNYNHAMCTAYIIDQLKENGFIVKYTSPNLLFVSWKHWIPSYVRHEIKKKTGIIVDGYGNKLVDGKIVEEDQTSMSTTSIASDKQKLIGNIEAKKIYKSIDTYKPSGNLYNNDILKAIQSKTLK